MLNITRVLHGQVAAATCHPPGQITVYHKNE